MVQSCITWRGYILRNALLGNFYHCVNIILCILHTTRWCSLLQVVFAVLIEMSSYSSWLFEWVATWKAMMKQALQLARRVFRGRNSMCKCPETHACMVLQELRGYKGDCRGVRWKVQSEVGERKSKRRLCSTLELIRWALHGFRVQLCTHLDPFSVAVTEYQRLGVL